VRAEKPEELAAVLEKGFSTPGTVVMDIIVHKESNVFPMMPGGAAHYEIVMDPEVYPDFGKEES
jgi:acetolactate synthase-1/2/3 large subunit